MRPYLAAQFPPKLGRASPDAYSVPPPSLSRSSHQGAYSAGQLDCLVARRKSTRINVTRLKGKEKKMFLGLMRSMIQWRPEDRKTARELLKHPWFDGVYPHSGCRLEPE